MDADRELVKKLDERGTGLEIAKKIGVSSSYWSYIRNGKRKMSRNVASAICSIFPEYKELCDRVIYR